jgi:hypothetical protein
MGWCRKPAAGTHWTVREAARASGISKSPESLPKIRLAAAERYLFVLARIRSDSSCSFFGHRGPLVENAHIGDLHAPSPSERE